jgi:protein O-GlcNAc transferase
MKKILKKCLKIYLHLERNLYIYMNRTKDNVYQIEYKNNSIKFYLPNLFQNIPYHIFRTKNFYEIDLLEDIFARNNDNMVIIDVGANIGNHSIYFAKVCKAEKVYSFEPQKSIYEIAKKNIELNNISSKVELINKALGSQSGKGNIEVVNSSDLGCSKVVFNSINGEIAITTLDEFIYTKNSHIDLIKLDVEGMELEILKGSKGILEKFKPMLYIEAHTNHDFVNISTFLKQFGYIAISRFCATPTYLYVATDNYKNSSLNVS